MSLHSTSSALPLRGAPRRDMKDSTADAKLFTAVALLIAVLIADVLLVLAATPSLADLASFYVTTT